MSIPGIDVKSKVESLHTNKEMNRDQFVVVHIWRPMINGKYVSALEAATHSSKNPGDASVGHVSISTHIGEENRYMSMWPSIDPGLAPVLASFENPAKDLVAEHRIPDAQITLYSLNVSDINRLFSHFEEQLEQNKMYWGLVKSLPGGKNKNLTQNCASGSWTLLLEGNMGSICHVDQYRTGPQSSELRKKYNCDQGDLSSFNDMSWRDFIISPAGILHLVSATKERELSQFPLTEEWDKEHDLKSLLYDMAVDKIKPANEFSTDQFNVKLYTIEMGKKEIFTDKKIPYDKLTYWHHIYTHNKFLDLKDKFDVGILLLENNITGQITMRCNKESFPVLFIGCALDSADNNPSSHYLLIINSSDTNIDNRYCFLKVEKYFDDIIIKFYENTKALIGLKLANGKFDFFTYDFEQEGSLDKRTLVLIESGKNASDLDQIVQKVLLKKPEEQSKQLNVDSATVKRKKKKEKEKGGESEKSNNRKSERKSTQLKPTQLKITPAYSLAIASTAALPLGDKREEQYPEINFEFTSPLYKGRGPNIATLIANAKNTLSREKNLETYRVYGCYLSINGQYLEAIEAYKTALSLPINTIAPKILENRLQMTRYNLAGIYYHLGRYDEALATYEALYKSREDNHADAYLHHACILIKLGRYNEALISIEKAYQNDNMALVASPGNMQIKIAALGAKAAVYYKLKKYSEAINIAKQARDLHTSSKTVVEAIYPKYGSAYQAILGVFENKNKMKIQTG